MSRLGTYFCYQGLTMGRRGLLASLWAPYLDDAGAKSKAVIDSGVQFPGSSMGARSLTQTTT